jgi:eukaryotic-like serine/threonine-protein kinase
MNSAISPSLAHCLECHAPLSPAETQGLCARCLLKIGLASQFGQNSVADAGARRLVPPPMFPFDFGGYRILRLLGRGGMGAAYEAEQLESGRRVALKVLGHAIDSPEMRKRFLREGRLAASVNHPNSVYIFGAEEIDGAPVIAMELVAGGTLRDRLKKGPLPAPEAVDAALQIIAGLEAAHGGGVLHRDVKPANCFVAPDGTVKIGDYGLSISTLARHDSELTASGVLLGTPSFAPPEQLRGDELDLRADIYSVGATLFALLTGRPPFEGENAVQVVAAVLDKTPISIAATRQDVPAGLVQIVMRCLAKKRDDRFANYAALRDALLPFSANVPAVAPIGLRFVAGLLDNTLAFLPLTVMTILLAQGPADAWTTGSSPEAACEFLGALMFAAVYFAACEGRWGAAPGKALCGLRVVGPNGAAPGFSRALLRAAIYVIAYHFGDLIHPVLTVSIKSPAPWSWFSYLDLGTVMLALLFVSMRRRNGFAALHELASHTRTVIRAKSAARPRLEAPEWTAPSTESERLGPYRIAGPIAGGAFLAGYDELLRRHVWIRQCATDAPPLDAARRAIARASRLRWLGGARSQAANWDAFEAPPGRPLREIPAQPWAVVRGWLRDLAEEIDYASKDGELPPQIGLDHVWITADSRAVLLDEPWPSNAPPTLLFKGADNSAAQHFLDGVAIAALDRSPLPLHARDFLDKLGGGAFDRITFVLGNLQSLLAKPAVVSPRRRFASLALLPACALFLSVVMGLTMLSVGGHKSAKITGPRQAEWHALTNALVLYAALNGDLAAASPIRMPKHPSDKEMVEMAQCYLSAHFGELIQSATFDHDAETAGLDAHQRELARGAVAAQRRPKPELVEEADAEFGPALAKMDDSARKTTPLFVLAFFAGELTLIGLANLLGIAILGFDPILRIFGLAVIDRSGLPAGRWRVLARSALVWSPLIAGWIGIFATLFFHGSNGWQLSMGLFTLAAFDFLVGVPWTLLRPNAGPHDLIARTRVTPR